jgi:hypothetical protein
MISCDILPLQALAGEEFSKYLWSAGYNGLLPPALRKVLEETRQKQLPEELSAELKRYTKGDVKGKEVPAYQVRNAYMSYRRMVEEQGESAGLWGL